MLKKQEINRKIFKSHKETSLWLNELDYIQDDQIFLKHLLSSHFLELSSSKLYEPTRKLINKLKNVEAVGNELFDTIQTHNKHLATLIESLQTNSEKEFKKEHEKIENEFNNYVLNFKYVKKKIFNTIKEIMKIHKQKLLLHK